jgi:uncharacterized OB-fold protein
VIEVVQGKLWNRPTPLGEGDYGPFFEACAQGRLLIQICERCGHRQFYPRPFCVRCAADVAWLETSGRGSLYTFTVIRQFRGEPFASELPYALGMVDLDEGVRMFGGITDVDPADLRVGVPLVAYAVEYEPGRAMPHWRPAR